MKRSEASEAGEASEASEAGEVCYLVLLTCCYETLRLVVMNK